MKLLSRCRARLPGRSDLESLLLGVGESIRRIVDFDYVGMTLHDAKDNRMHGYVLRAGRQEQRQFCEG